MVADTPTNRLRVELLGHVALVVDGEPVALRGARETALVARLALDPDRTVLSSVLLEDVWNGSPPASGTGALRVQIRRLRTLLEEHGVGDALPSDTGGYRLAVPHAAVDLLQCAALADRAIAAADDPDEAAHLFREAEELWRERPLAGLEDFAFATAAIATIERSVHLARRFHADALIRTGRPQGAVDILERLVVEDRLDSELAVTAMRASRLAGRPHEALRIAQEHREQLREIGLFPTEDLAEEEQRSLGPERPFPRTDDLIGRDAECQELGRLVNDLMTGRGGVIVIEGEAGSGKTALLRLTAAISGQLGIRVLEAQADQLEVNVPLRFAADLLRTLPRSRAALNRAGQELLGGSDLAAMAAAGVDLASWLRAAITDEILGEVEGELGEPTLVIVDDLHWADRSSLWVLRALGRLGSSTPVAVVGAGRSSPDANGWASLLAIPSARHLNLAPLSTEQSLELAGRLVNGEPDPSLAAVVARADGLPVLIEELVRTLHNDGRLATTGTGTVGVVGDDPPESLSMIVDRRLAGVSPSLRDLCAHAAVLGGRCRLDQLASFMGTTALTAARGVSDRSLNGILETHGQVVAFRHDLVRDAVEESIPTAVRAELHRRAAQLLADAGSPVTTIAAHAVLAATTEDDAQLVQWLRDAADETASLEPEGALRFLDRALELTAGQPAARYEVQRARAEALIAAGAIEEALDLMGVLRSLDAEREPEVVLRLGGVRLLTDDSEAGRREVDAIIPEVADPAVKARLLALSALLSLAMMDLRASAITAREADTLAEAIDDPVSRSVATGMLGRITSLGHSCREGLRLNRLAVELAEMDPTGEAHRYQPWLFCGLSALDIDHHELVEEALERGRGLAREQYAGWADPMYLAMAASLAYRRGGLDEAEEAAVMVLDREDDIGHGPADAWAHSFLSLIADRRGDPKRAAVEADEADSAFAHGRSSLGVDFVVLARARVQERAGDAVAALETLRGSWEMLEGVGLRACLPLLAPGIARLAYETDRPGSAEGIVDECRALAASTEIAAHRALLARVEGLLAGDTDRMVEACRLYEDTERALELADCRAEAERLG